MKNNQKEKLRSLLKSLIPLLISVLIFDTAFDQPLYKTSKNEIIKQNHDVNLIIPSRQESFQRITNIINSFFNNNMINPTTFETQSIPILKDKHKICINRINKYPRWSKSTFS